MKMEEISTNENCRIYHHRAKGSVWGSYEVGVEYWSPHTPGNDRAELPAFARLLTAIPGVSSLLIRPYEVYVSKGHAFEWSEIHDKVCEIIRMAEEEAARGGFVQ